MDAPMISTGLEHPRLSCFFSLPPVSEGSAVCAQEDVIMTEIKNAAVDKGDQRTEIRETVIVQPAVSTAFRSGFQCRS